MRKTLNKTVKYLYYAAILIFICVLLGVGGYFGWHWLKGERMRAEAQREYETLVTGTDLSQTALPGDVIGMVRIPRLQVNSYLVEMSDTEDKPNLDRGVGHIAGHGWPGSPGNLVLAGHRTTFAHPFLHIDQLAAGDLIEVETPDRIADYRVTSYTVVTPDQVEVMDPTPDATITLISCHPPHSAAYRYIVKGALERVVAKVPGQGIWADLDTGMEGGAEALARILPS
ncbi:MAG: class E sortase [Candidatus Geothermincolia bacterium]